MAEIKREICDPKFVTVSTICKSTAICGGKTGYFETVMDGSVLCQEEFIDCGCPL